MADVFFDADHTLRAQGELVFVDAQIDATTGAVPIKVRLLGNPPALLSGQGVQVRLQLGTEPDAKVVPEAALQHAQEGTYVYVVRDGKAVVQPVKRIRSLDGEAGGGRRTACGRAGADRDSAAPQGGRQGRT